MTAGPFAGFLTACGVSGFAIALAAGLGYDVSQRIGSEVDGSQTRYAITRTEAAQPVRAPDISVDGPQRPAIADAPTATAGSPTPPAGLAAETPSSQVHLTKASDLSQRRPTEVVGPFETADERHPVPMNGPQAAAMDGVAAAGVATVGAALGYARLLPPESQSAETAVPSTHQVAAIEPPGELISVEAANECLQSESCIDQYLWLVYQRAPKVDMVRVQEQTSVTVHRRGKTRVVMRTVSKLVDEDFTWKDPAAAEKAGKPLMDYVIGGMDRSFKVKLYRALRAADDAGLSPGMTSGFRDDYRQGLASGLKAAVGRSYHGGSQHGGYGHGVAADIVSVRGETRVDRWRSSEELWKWVDAHSQEFGIGRPYLGRDPAHFAPTDGKEYASHRGGAHAQVARRGTSRRVALARRLQRDEARRNGTTVESDKHLAHQERVVAKRHDGT
jgi:hypothetical protein